MKLMEMTGDAVTKLIADGAGVPLAIYISAAWCPPCRVFGPVVEEVAREQTSTMFVKVDLDANASLAEQYYIRSIPTILLFKGSMAVGQLVGAKPKVEVLEFLKLAQ